MDQNTRQHNEVWEECLRIMSQNIIPAQFDMWIRPIKSVSLSDSVLTIEVPSDFFREYIESAYIDILSRTLRRVIGQDAKLVYTMRPVNGQKELSFPATLKSAENKEVSIASGQPGYNPGAFIYPGLHKVKINPRLNPVLNFDNLISGDCNRMAMSAGENISYAPGKTPFNPLFIFGGPGLGKTHMAQAIGNEIKNKFPDLVVLYVTGNEFKTQFIDAVTVRNKLNDFLAYYMKIDVLIVDDIQDLQGPSSQNAFFNVFNHLHQNGKQLIFTSDRPPVELQNFEERLLSRFKWGLSVELLHPDYETRLGMLHLRAKRDGIQIGDNVLEYLANSVRTNFRELEGALISVAAHIAVSPKSNELEIAEKVIGRLILDDGGNMSIEKVKQVVCDYFNLESEMLNSSSRKRNIVQARQIAMFLSRNLVAGCSLNTIGSEIGGRDHATVIHACSTVADLMQTDKSFKKYVSEIETMLKSDSL